MRSMKMIWKSGLSAAALGLLAAGGAVGVTMAAAPAYAQSSTKEFVDAYSAAKTAYEGRKYAEAVTKLDDAARHAKTTKEKAAVEEMRIGSYSQLRKYNELLKAIDARNALGGVSGSQVTNFKRLQADAYDRTGQKAKAMAIIEQMVGEGGGSSTELAYIAQAALNAKQYDKAIQFANKAIEKMRAEGKTRPEPYNILLKAYRDTAKMDQYYATLERVAPVFKSEVYWKPLIEKAKTEKGFKSAEGLLDVYRAMEATNVKLTDADKVMMGEQALTRQMPIEAEKILTPLVKSGAVGGAKDSKAERNKRMYATVQEGAKTAKAGGLEKAEAAAAAAATGAPLVLVGEQYYTNGDYKKAVELIEKGIAKGQLEPGALAYAQLHLGMAQMKAGQKDAARKTWSEVKADNGAGWLARAWTAISKT
jgi:tetratricopeptide (TPR) repeat protein